MIQLMWRWPRIQDPDPVLLLLLLLCGHRGVHSLHMTNITQWRWVVVTELLADRPLHAHQSIKAPLIIRTLCILHITITIFFKASAL